MTFKTQHWLISAYLHKTNLFRTCILRLFLINASAYIVFIFSFVNAWCSRTRSAFVHILSLYNYRLQYGYPFRKFALPDQYLLDKCLQRFVYHKELQNAAYHDLDVCYIIDQRSLDHIYKLVCFHFPGT